MNRPEFEKKKAEVLKEIPEEFHFFLSTIAWDEGYSSGYQNVLNLLIDLVWDFKIDLEKFTTRIKQEYGQELDQVRAIIRDQGVLLEGGF